MTAASDQAAPAIELIEVGKRYGEVPCSAASTWRSQPGEFVALLGPSGCGKSTLLKLIAGLEELTDGEIYVGGRLANYLQAQRPRRRHGVPELRALSAHDRAREPRLPAEDERRAARGGRAPRWRRAATLLQLGAQLDRYPDELSGGQRQRVALGRAIVREPLAFLMDEPLSNLDALLRVEMRTELVRLHKRVGRTTIYVTHDQVEAMTMANRIVLMHKGVIQQVGTPGRGLCRRRPTPSSPRFVGSPPMNLLPGPHRIRRRTAHVPRPVRIWRSTDWRRPRSARDRRPWASGRSRSQLVGAGEPQAPGRQRRAGRARRRRLLRPRASRGRRGAERPGRCRQPDPRGRPDLRSPAAGAAAIVRRRGNRGRQGEDHERARARRRCIAITRPIRPRAGGAAPIPLPEPRAAGALSADDLRRPAAAARCRRPALPGPGRCRLVADRQPRLRGCDPLSRRSPRQGLQHAHRQPGRASVLAQPAARSRRTRAVHRRPAT